MAVVIEPLTSSRIPVTAAPLQVLVHDRASRLPFAEPSRLVAALGTAPAFTRICSVDDCPRRVAPWTATTRTSNAPLGTSSAIWVAAPPVGRLASTCGWPLIPPSIRYAVGTMPADGATHAKVTRLPVRETMRRSVGAVPVPERTSSAVDARPAPALFTARTRRS